MARKKTTGSGSDEVEKPAEDSVSDAVKATTEANSNDASDTEPAVEETEGSDDQSTEDAEESPEADAETVSAEAEPEREAEAEPEVSAENATDDPSTEAQDASDEPAEADASVTGDSEETPEATDPQDEDGSTEDPEKDLEDVAEAEPAKEPTVSQPSREPAQQPANPGALVFGGVVAGAIGFAAAYFGLAQQSDPALGGLTKDVETLQAELTALADAPAPEPDLSPVLTQIEEVSGQLSEVDARFAEIVDLIDTVNARIDGIEVAAVSETLPEGAQDAFQAELQAAKDAIAAEREALAKMMADARASESQANEAAQAAVQRAALGEVMTALDTGAAFSEPLSELAAMGLPVSDELTETGTTGVTPLASLQQSFPAAARDALNASRAATEGTSGFQGFVRAQLGVRSLEPREGDDPDAVLSRAEAALGSANISEALAEIETLPPEALAALASWIDDATKRRDTVLAVQGLSDSLN
ncbi:MAG: hypothetical protein AAF678_10130 [Pseudomonadota bacterium]